MSSGFSGGFPDLYTATNNSQIPFRSPITGILSDPSSQIAQQRPDLIGKRSLAEFQAHQQLQMFQQQNQLLGFQNRNVKPRTYQQSSPVSPLSPVDFYASISPETNQNIISSNSRYGFPILQQFRPQSQRTPNFSTLSYPNLVQNRVVKNELVVGQESEKKMMNNKLQELEKQLLNDDDDDEQGDDSVSIVTNNEWSDTIQSLISPSPTSSSSTSCTSSSASPQTICPKQSLTEAASAISEGKNDVASEILTRLNQVSNVKGTSEQRLIAYMTSALRRRVNPTENPPPVVELYSEEHTVSTQMLYEVSPCFKLGFMAANLAILEAISNQNLSKLHVVDFDIGHGGQYVHLIYALAAGKVKKPISLKITTFLDFTTEKKLKLVRESLMGLANEKGVDLNFNLLSLKICDLSLESLGVEIDEALAVNFAFRLYKLPDESVTTENLRDELLRRVKGLSPTVVTVVEQEMNANTATFVARVTEACGYYGSLFDSLDATVPRDNSERIRIEEGLGRKLANSVACEGRDRVERCEVFGKWRARLGMAGFKPNPLSQNLADSLNSKLNSGTRGNPGFTVKVENGGLCFGWMGRTLTVASAWR